MSKNAAVIIVPRKEKDIHPIPPGGSQQKYFKCDLTAKRNYLKNEMIIASQKLQNQFERFPDVPSILKIVVREDAIAKSHRPMDFLGNMKIVSFGMPTEIFVSAFKYDIDETINNISNRTTQNYIANLSTIESIQGFLPENKQTNLIDKNKKEHNLFLKIFGFDDVNLNVKCEKILDKLFSSLDIKFKRIYVGNKVCSRVLYNVSLEQINEILKIPFVKSLSEPSGLFSANSVNDVFGCFSPNLKYKFDNNIVIGVIDSGISSSAISEDYIYSRENYVPEELQDKNHGTFVASTILFGNELNCREEKTPIHFKLLDVTLLSSNESGYVIYEDEMCECLKEVVEKYHNEVKIWNLSFGLNGKIANDNQISELGSLCDNLQKEYDVQFFISAGNYSSKPVRKWPVPICSNNDRIISPSDSIVGLSIGSMAEKENSYSYSKINKPSPFSRRGPGACLLFKPDLVDYGGNNDIDYSFSGLGVKGLCSSGKVIENIGTSFSTPLVAYKYAKIYSSMADKNHLLAKTMLIHNALLNSPDIVGCDDDERKYYGFGKPSTDSETILECRDNEATVVLKCDLQSGTMIDIKDFPVPESMYINGKFKGEIFATLVADPSFNEKYGYEYSRINFDLSVGSLEIVPDGTTNYQRKLSPIKPKNGVTKFESQLVKEDLKWNPIKTYYSNFTKGVNFKDGCRVSVSLHSRINEAASFHSCYVAITFKGDSDKIYDDEIRQIKEQSFEINEIKIREEIRN